MAAATTRSHFGLFQAMTNVASHEMSGLRSIAVGTSITEYFLDPNRKEAMSHTTPEDAIDAATSA